MISTDSLLREWILDIKGMIKGSDPGIIEKLIRSLYLCEQLVQTGLDFTFKGGTCLTLLTQEPRRFSTDLDIVTLASRNDVENALKHVCGISEFDDFELDKRRSYLPGIPKAHYAMLFTSVVNRQPTNIQLDILYTQQRYPRTHQTSIQNKYLHQNGAPLSVTTPDLDSLLGDKLTAFAPNTVGVPYWKRKELEIIKQLFDLHFIYGESQSFETVATSYDAHVDQEFTYHEELKGSREDVLKDTLSTCALLAKPSRIQTDVEIRQYAELEQGYMRFRSFPINIPFHRENVILAGSKVALMAAKLLKGDLAPLKQTPDRINRQEFIIPHDHPRYGFLTRALKAVEASASFYWFQALKTLGEL